MPWCDGETNLRCWAYEQVSEHVLFEVTASIQLGCNRLK
jgi:hypothetical protein